MRNTMRCLTTFAIVIATPSTAFSGTSVSLVGIGQLPGGIAGSDVNALSRDGSTVVGWSSTAAGTEAIRFRNGQLEGLGDFDGNGTNSVALAASADGSVVVGQGTFGGVLGSYYITSSPPFVWTASRGLQVTGGGGSWNPIGLSGAGTCITPDGKTWGVSSSWAWVSSVGPMTNNVYAAGYGGRVTSISDDGSVVFGQMAVGNGSDGYRPTTNRATIDSFSGFKTVSGSPNGDPNGNWIPVTCSGDGRTALLNSTDAIYKWSSAGVQPLPLSAGMEAISASPDLSIVCGRQQSGTGYRAVIWTASRGVQSIEAYVQGRFGVLVPSGGRTLTACKGVSANGLIFAGSGTNASGQQEGWVLRIVYDWNDNGIDDAQEIKDGLIGDVNNDGIADCYQSGIDCPGPNIAADPGFEAGNVLGDCTSELLTAGTSTGSWQVVSGVAERANRSKSCSGSNWAAEFGTYAIELRSTGGGPGTIRQTITTEPGRHYRVSFWMSANCTSGGAVSVRASAGNSSKIFTRTCEGTGKQSWLRCEFDFVAGLTTETLEFASENQPYSGPVIDAISVSDVTVGCPSDLDGNGQVDSGDIGLLLLNFGPCQ